MKSIRGRLLFWLILGILPIIGASMGFLYFNVRRSLRTQFDAALAGRINTLVRMSEWWDGEIEEEDENYEDFGDDSDNLVRFEFAELGLPEFAPSRDAHYYQVWDASGVVQARSPSLQGESLTGDPLTANDGSIRHATLPDGRPGRIAWRSFVPPVEYDSIPNRPDTSYRIAYGRSTEGLLQTLSILRMWLLLSGAATLGVAALLIWFGVELGLKPLDVLSSEISSIGETDLARHVSVDDSPAELKPVCIRINAMLDRLHAVMERERRFTSDVAHELRTPLAELRTLAEVSSRRDNLSEADRRSYRDAGDIAVRLERLINTLLELARCSSGQITRKLSRLSLERLVASTWTPLEDAAREKGLSVRLETTGADEVDSDPLVLGTILSNLLSNAVNYTPRGGTIALNTEKRDGAVWIELSNSTDDLTPNDLPKLAEKFWRKHGADMGTEGHLGLGLTLVESLSRVLGARFECEMPSAGIFRATLVHPA